MRSAPLRNPSGVRALWVSGGVFCLTVAALGVALSTSQGQNTAKSNQETAVSSPSTAASRAPQVRVAPPVVERRLREGSALTDQAGCFKTAGDRIIFTTSDSRLTMVCLENLNLERVSRAITDNMEQLEWKVTGTLTEYSGANYLLVERAILKSRTDARDDR